MLCFFKDDTDGAISDIISVAESWAYHYGRILADTKYGVFSSRQFEQGFEYRNGTIFQFGGLVTITGLNAHLNLLEDFSPNRMNDPPRWIPEGIYYDLIDDLNDFIVYGGPIEDNVTGFTNQQFFNAMDIDVRSMPQFRARFFSENGFNQAVTNLFTQYHY